MATGAVLLGNAGTPTATTLSGDVTVGATGTVTIANNAVTTVKILDGAVTSPKMAISNASDTQSASISADGVLTGISITPGVGTYLALGTAELLRTGVPGAVGTATIAVRVNAVASVTGPASSMDEASSGISNSPLIVIGVVTVSNGGHAVDLYGDLTVATPTVAITGGQLVLVRLA